ncbi:MAG: hypothetical protein ACD_61C00116G0003 [uncultured bacterium]|nr:MAG: hypothetical protein ACD_61C00116G0003 [uncultured bacterium]
MKLIWQKVIFIVGWIMTLMSVFMLFIQSVSRSYFHQDDVSEIAVTANWHGWSSLMINSGEHIIFTFWALLRTEWIIFGLNFTGYMVINSLLHLLVLLLIFNITHKLTKSLLWSSVAVWGFVINANWFVVVWWITSQMVLLSTIFALVSFRILLEIREKPRKIRYLFLYLFSILPGLSWGLGLSWPIWPLMVYGIDYKKRRITPIGFSLILAQLSLIIFYFVFVRNNLSAHTDPTTWLSSPLNILAFVVVGISNTLVGRWLWPPENLTLRVIFLGILALVMYASRSCVKKINKDMFFGAWVAFGCFLTFAIPRWKFGIGHAMANYFAYFPLAFLLISLCLLLSKIRLNKIKTILILGVFLIHIPLSWIGFEEWAREWVVRPQQTKQYFSYLNGLKTEDCIDNEYLPEFVIPQKIWRVDYLWPVFQKDFDPFCEKK